MTLYQINTVLEDGPDFYAETPDGKGFHLASYAVACSLAAGLQYMPPAGRILAEDRLKAFAVQCPTFRDFLELFMPTEETRKSLLGE